MREGEAETVTGTYPREIAPLAEEVNELLRSNTQIIERARNQVGNLAHGLKTPLAVLRNEARARQGRSAGQGGAVRNREDDAAGHHLSRPGADRGAHAVVGKKADADAWSCCGWSRVMEKLNPNVTIAFKRPDASLPWFRGDEGDLEEMAGNLLDNACKWSEAARSASPWWPSARRRSAILLIRIEDDGPGLTEEEAQKVLRRGVRLDEKTPGSGPRARYRQGTG